MNQKKITGKDALIIYAILQVALLIFLRKFYLLTVYQTAATYLAVALGGAFLLYIPQKRWTKVIQDVYLLLWSSFHGVIVLGFLTQGTFYLTLTQLTMIQIVNLFLGFLIYWLFYIVSGKYHIAVKWGNVMLGFLGILNHYLVRFRGAPFCVADIKAARTAGNVFMTYNYMPDIYILVAIADLLVWYILLKKTYEDNRAEEKVKRRNPWNLAVSAVMLLGCIWLFGGAYQAVYAATGQFAKDSYLADLLADALGSTEMYPEGYSSKEAERILQESLVNEQKKEQLQSEEKQRQPNIVVIMNEAFSDLRVLGEFETNVPVWEYWDTLQDNCVKGWANVSVLGGTTANSEYEFLSSDSVALYLNDGVIPYNSYFSREDKYESIVSVLKEQGYETTAFHPYLSSGWNRTQVYRAMQFDNIIFSEDLTEELDKMRLYVSDCGDYEYVKQWFEKKEDGKPQFFFNVTMQNHGGYTYDGEDFQTTVQLAGDMAGKFPQTEQYLSLIRESDLALRGLLTYFENYDEPVVVVMFGDHQPRLEDEFYSYVTGDDMAGWSVEQQMNQYKTPFIIWHNYETDAVDLGDVSLNYLGSILLQDTGLAMSDYQKYVLRQYEVAPVVSRLGAKDNLGAVYVRDSEEFARMTEEMQMLLYWHTVDKERTRESVGR